MADHNNYDELDDLEFERLFASLDDVKASDELKASTLDAIFAQANELTATGAEKAEERGFVLIEGSARTEDTRADAAQEDVSTMMQVHTPKATETAAEHTSTASTKRARAAWKRSSFMLRVAAALLVFALVTGGTVACAVPTTHVYATTGETTFDLGVNLFGFTVSAEADSDAGKEILEDADVRFKRFGDAFDRILEAYEQRGGEDEPTVRVESSAPFGGGERLDEEAQNVMDSHEWHRDGQEERDEGETRDGEETRNEETRDGEVSPSMGVEGTSVPNTTGGSQDGGQTSNGNAPQDESAKTDAPQRNTERRAPEATSVPTGQTQPTDGRVGETDAGQPGQGAPNQDAGQPGQGAPDQGAGQPSGGASEMDGGGIPRN